MPFVAQLSCCAHYWSHSVAPGLTSQRVRPSIILGSSASTGPSTSTCHAPLTRSYQRAPKDRSRFADAVERSSAGKDRCCYLVKASGGAVSRHSAEIQPAVLHPPWLYMHPRPQATAAKLAAALRETRYGRGSLRDGLARRAASRRRRVRRAAGSSLAALPGRVCRRLNDNLIRWLADLRAGTKGRCCAAEGDVGCA